MEISKKEMKVDYSNAMSVVGDLNEFEATVLDDDAYGSGGSV